MKGVHRVEQQGNLSLKYDGITSVCNSAGQQGGFHESVQIYNTVKFMRRTRYCGVQSGILKVEPAEENVSM